MKSVIPLIALAMTAGVMAEDGYLGVMSANESQIESIANESGTLTGDFSTKSLVSLATETSQWQLDGPTVISKDGEVLGQLSTVDTATTSLFNESIWVQVPYMDRAEECIGSINNNFSIGGAKIYDSQSSELKDKIQEVNDEFIQR